MRMPAEGFLEDLNVPLKDGAPPPYPPYKFTRQIDIVIIGTCSYGHGRGWGDHTRSRYDDVPNQDYFAGPLDSYKPKTVLLISECCGTYSQAFQRKLRKMYPEIEWIIPEVRDYGERIDRQDCAEDLLRAGILCPA